MNVRYGVVLRRILEPIFLGSLSNLIVNFLFNPHSYTFRLDEFTVACILSIPVTELNRYIDQKLERKISWIENPQKRFGTHLLFISMGLLVSLNVLGNAYMWFTQKGLFSWKQIGIINLVVLCFAIVLTLINWSIHFYFQWRSAETGRLCALRMMDDLKQKMVLGSRIIELQKGTTTLKIESKAIRVAKIESGTVRVYSDKDIIGVFEGSLGLLYSRLPDYLFFQVTRDAILHRDVIKAVSSSTFGKIQLTIQEINNVQSTYMISRPKAAAFRKWYNSNSAKKE
jgi:hypothetical protein